MSKDERATITEMIKDVRIAMLTYVDADGHLVAKPMATQDAEFTGDIWFITERDSAKVDDLVASPQVNVSYAGKGSWVSVSGTATVVDDRAKLEELWDTYTDIWMEGGPENPNNVLVHVEGDTAEYWGGNGGMVRTAVALAKKVVTGDRGGEERNIVQL